LSHARQTPPAFLAADAALLLVAADAAFERRAFLDSAAVYRPRRELQKAAPRNFDAFFSPRGKKRQSNFLRCRAAQARPAFAMRGFSRAIALFAMSQSSGCSKGVFTMTETTTPTIAALNDRFRQAEPNIDPAGASLGKKVITAGIRALDLTDQIAIAEKLRAFDDFTEDNDPHGEHDFGAFDLNGQRIFWKIDYYDRARFRSGHDYGSENPADPSATLRVLTIMLASEY
jgi:hypothetical protein